MPTKSTIPAPSYVQMYAQVRPDRMKNSFFRRINACLDWRGIRTLLNKKYTKPQNAVGNPAYDALMKCKIRLLQVWYGLIQYNKMRMMKDKLVPLLVATLSIFFTSCNSGHRLEEYLFSKRKSVSGYCNVNSTKYEVCRIYDPTYHGYDPQYTNVDRSMLIVPEGYIFSYVLLSDSKEKLPDFKYQLYFYLPYGANGWGESRRYEIAKDQRWVHQLPSDFSILDVQRIVGVLKRKDQLGVAILRNNITQEEVSLSGVFDVVPDKKYPNYYTIRYQLRGKERTGQSIELDGQNDTSGDLKM